MIKYFFSLLFVVSYINAEITLNEINSKPPCRAKDFMIWQYLRQDISKSQAQEAYNQLSIKNNRMLFVYAKKTDDSDIKRRVLCKKRKDLLNITDQECLKLAVSPYKTLALTDEQREELLEKTDDNQTKKLLKIQSGPYTQKAYEKYDANTVLTFFIKSPSSFRRKNLNIFLDETFINQLSNSWKISQFVRIVVNDDKLNKLQLSLLNLNSVNLNSKTIFLLAINHLRHSSKTQAMNFFVASLKKSKSAMEIDKNYFWLYLVSKNKEYLKKLLLSMDINIYTIYAHEVLNEGFENYFTDVETINSKSQENIQNPFEWNNILKKIRSTPKSKLFDLASSYRQKEMMPVQSLIIQRAYDYKMHGYIMPYNRYLKNLTIDDKALVYAIMRQESLMIPSALSRSYALGLMQLMPFLVDSISKQCNEHVCYSDMFKPKKNIDYALKHLKWMKKSLYHPLFIAYAYNGGMGFLKKHLKQGTFSDAKYEPFLSMEMMLNSETREYGKKVLANYVMYKKIMGEKISIVYLFDTLKDPKKTDRFRAR
jgi:soluble lytic murein transglycosylase